jgi:hypothetical protein
MRTIFKHPNGCFFIRAILIPSNALCHSKVQTGDPAGYCVLVGLKDIKILTF